MCYLMGLSLREDLNKGKLNSLQKDISWSLIFLNKLMPDSDLIVFFLDKGI